MKKIILILIIMLMISFITACNDNLTNNEMEDYKSNQDQDLNDHVTLEMWDEELRSDINMW